MRLRPFTEFLTRWPRLAIQERLISAHGHRNSQSRRFDRRLRPVRVGPAAGPFFVVGLIIGIGGCASGPRDLGTERLEGEGAVAPGSGRLTGTDIYRPGAALRVYRVWDGASGQELGEEVREVVATLGDGLWTVRVTAFDPMGRASAPRDALLRLRGDGAIEQIDVWSPREPEPGAAVLRFRHEPPLVMLPGWLGEGKAFEHSAVFIEVDPEHPARALGRGTVPRPVRRGGPDDLGGEGVAGPDGMGAGQVEGLVVGRGGVVLLTEMTTRYRGGVDIRRTASLVEASGDGPRVVWERFERSLTAFGIPLRRESRVYRLREAQPGYAG